MFPSAVYLSAEAHGVGGLVRLGLSEMGSVIGLMAALGHEGQCLLCIIWDQTTATAILQVRKQAVGG